MTNKVSIDLIVNTVSFTVCDSQLGMEKEQHTIKTMKGLGN